MKFLFYCILLLLSTNLTGQYKDQWFNTDNGLPQNSINDILKDKYGFIWISTEKGIVRYDGNQFKLYDGSPISNMGYGDFFGNIAKDSIINYNNYEDYRIMISKRNVHVKKSVKIPHKVYFSGDKKYVKYHKTRLIPVFYKNIDSYFLETSKGTYYFNESSIEYIDRYTKDRIKLKIKFKHSDLMRVFAAGDSVFMADFARGKLLKLERGIVNEIEAPALLHNPDTKFYWHQLTGQIFLINHENIYSVQYKNGIFSIKFLIYYPEIKNHSFKFNVYL